MRRHDVAQRVHRSPPATLAHHGSRLQEVQRAEFQLAQGHFQFALGAQEIVAGTRPPHPPPRSPPVGQHRRSGRPARKPAPVPGPPGAAPPGRRADHPPRPGSRRRRRSACPPGARPVPRISGCGWRAAGFPAAVAGASAHARACSRCCVSADAPAHCRSGRWRRRSARCASWAGLGLGLRLPRT